MVGRGSVLAGKIAVVCGASQGIGRETAKEIVRLGGSVCVIARRPGPLEEAAREIRELAQDASQFVEAIPCDTTDMACLEPLLSDFVERRGVPDYLVNVVGFAHPEYVHKLSLDGFRRAMEVNYFGQLVPILCLLPHFVSSRKGHIANVASMMGYFGIIGYASYAPSKFAIVGLSEVLRHELRPYNIKISVLYPPDTDTPGFALENQTKPRETELISEGAGLMTAEQVARAFVKGILKERYAILPGEAGLAWRIHRHFPWLLRWITDRQHRQARARLAKEAQARGDR